MNYRIPDPTDDLQKGDIVRHENGHTYIVCVEDVDDNDEIEGIVLCSLDQPTKDEKVDYLLDLIGQKGQHVEALKILLGELVANRL